VPSRGQVSERQSAAQRQDGVCCEHSCCLPTNLCGAGYWLLLLLLLLLPRLLLREERVTRRDVWLPVVGTGRRRWEILGEPAGRSDSRESDVTAT